MPKPKHVDRHLNHVIELAEKAKKGVLPIDYTPDAGVLPEYGRDWFIAQIAECIKALQFHLSHGH